MLYTYVVNLFYVLVKCVKMYQNAYAFLEYKRLLLNVVISVHILCISLLFIKLLELLFLFQIITVALAFADVF